MGDMISEKKYNTIELRERGREKGVQISCLTHLLHTFSANIFLFKVTIETLEKGVKYVKSYS